MLDLEPLCEDGSNSADAASQLMSHHHLNNYYYAAATATPAAAAAAAADWHYNSPWTNVVPLLDGARVQARFNSCYFEGAGSMMPPPALGPAQVTSHDSVAVVDQSPCYTPSFSSRTSDTSEYLGAMFPF